jgi:hypothetical protein
LEGSACDSTLVRRAEAFIRLVYGRLDPDHSPAGLEQDPILTDMRRLFPGF